MKKILIAVGAIALLVLWACHLGPDDSSLKLDVQGDSTWLDFDRLDVLVRDTGASGDTTLERLFSGKLKALEDLHALSPGKYAGGSALFVIRGYRGDTLVFEQRRTFNEATGTAVVETTFATAATLTGFKASPESLTLYVGGNDSLLKALPNPAYARPGLEWSVEGDAIALDRKDGAYQAILKPRQSGLAYVSIKPKGSDSLALRVPVRVVEDIPKLEVSPAKAFIAPGKQVEFTVKSHQEFGRLVRFEWDLDGDGNWDDTLSGSWTGKDAELPKQGHLFDKAGKFTVRFRVKDGEGNYGTVSALVEVGERKPAVELLPKDTVISIRDVVRFRGEIQEPGGKLAGYNWDWDGNGTPDDVATLADSMTSLSVSRTYPDTGVFHVILNAKDSEGKIGADSVRVTVLLDAPHADAGPAVTAKSGVAVVFKGTAWDSLGYIVKYKWDFDGDGAFDDSSDALKDFSHAYAKEADYSARFQVRDDDGNVTTVVRIVKISDAPFIISAKRADTTISIKDNILMTATIRNDDGKDLQYSWDYNADGKYDDTTASNLKVIPVSKSHVFPAAGRFKATLRAVDSQGKFVTDTVVITVSLDAPKADLGKDDTVLIGETVPIKLNETANKFGSIVKRELQINDTVWIPVSKPDTVLTMSSVAGTIRVIGRVTDDDALTSVDTMLIVVKYPTENRLSGIFLTPGTFAPGFNPDTAAYTSTFANSVTSVVLGAVAKDPKASITVNGTALTSTLTSVTVNLKPGPNAVPIVVTAQDTSAKKTYTMNITRTLSANNFLYALAPGSDTLAPHFLNTTLPYTIALADTVDSLKLTPTLSDTTARVTVAGKAVATGSASPNISTPPGTTSIAVIVTAADKTVRTYTLTVKRAIWKLSGARGFSTASQKLLSFAVDKTIGYAGFSDSASSYSAAVMKFDGATWSVLGSGAAETNVASMDLRVNGGVPYVGMTEGSGLMVRKPAAGVWDTVGNTTYVSIGGVYTMNIAFDNANAVHYGYVFWYMQPQAYITNLGADKKWTGAGYTGGADSTWNMRLLWNKATNLPVLAYNEGAAGLYRAGVQTPVANVWTPVGTGLGFAIGDAPISFAMDSLGAYYYAYTEAATKKISVRKSTGAAWTLLGTAGFSTGEAASLNVAMMGTTPFVAYRDVSLSAIVVKYWNGAAWINFGKAAFTPGDVGVVKLAIEGGTVWVAYTEPGNANRASVMQRVLP